MNILVIVFVTFIVSFLLTFLAKRIAFHVNALDIPNERKIHKKAMPRCGGLAIFGGFLVGYMFYGMPSNQMLSILIGAFLIVIIGFIDDISPVKARYKFLGQIVAACVVVFYGKNFFTEISLLGVHFYLPLIINQLFSVLFIVAISNAINLIDGLDGLAAGISSINFATIAIIALLLNKIGGLDLTLSLIMVGSTLGFLVHNFPPAKIFMGDTGSYFLGYMIAVISLLGFKMTTITSLIVPIIILSIPIFDTILAILRRLLKGESIGTPDKEHFHHQLLKMKFSPKISIIVIYCINILFSIVSIFYVIGDNKLAIALYVILMILLLFIVLNTDILFSHKKDSQK